MFYKFPQNKRYMINKDLVVKLDGKKIKTKDDKIVLEIYGEEREVDLLWMYGISLWCIEPLPEYRESIFKLEFKPIDLKSHKVKEDIIPVFKEPVIVKTKFRLIPHVPVYAISEIGEVLDIAENVLVKQTVRTNYLVVGHPYNGRIYNVHRLVALTWNENDDFIAKPIVNHLDHNKLNNNTNNLEWSSFSDNGRHAIESGLSPQAEAYLVLDLETNEEKVFYSVTTLSAYVGLNTIPHLSSRVAKHSQYVLMKRYIIKSTENKKPWIKDIDSNNNHVSRNASTAGIIEAKNIETGEVITGTVSELSVKLNINRDTLDGLRRKYKQHNDYGYVFRDPSYMSWDNIRVVAHVLKPKQILAINVKTNENVLFKSLREASRFLSCDKKNISRRLNTGEEYKSYIFKTQ